MAIKGVNKTAEERKYRAIEKDSSSSLKDFSIDRRKYYRKYILQEKVEDKDNLAILMGKLVETLLFEPEEFDNRFYMSSSVNIPTGLMLEFVEGLYKYSKEATDGFGVVTRAFEDIVEDAYIYSGFKISKVAVLGKFIGSDAEIYYREIREVRSKNLTVITNQDVTNAEKIVEELQTNEFTKEIINCVTSNRFTVLNQFKVDGYELFGLEFKSMLDKVIIDHEKKIVHIYDLKCTWSVENFYKEYYLYRRTYIQAFLYHTAMIWYAQQEGSPCFGYVVEYPQFIVCDSINYYSPLIYTLEMDDMADAYNGFTAGDKNYPGVRSLIRELKWAKDNDIWNISQANYESKGIVNIKT
jgi:PDDEXK-like domain of unknown function (DUF3799)